MIDTAITVHNVIAWSLLGGAAKTHDDYKQKKVKGVIVIVALIINLIYATLFGFMAVELWNFTFPAMGAIDFIISFSAGFIGANIFAFFKRVDWSGIVTGFFSKWTR